MQGEQARARVKALIEQMEGALTRGDALLATPEGRREALEAHRDQLVALMNELQALQGLMADEEREALVRARWQILEEGLRLARE